MLDNKGSMKLRVKKILLLVAFLALVISGAALLITRQQRRQSTDKLTVTASFYPLYDFARQVGSGRVSITNMTPAGAEPHDFEPSPKALADAQHSAVFIYNGGSLEPWVTGFLQDYRHTTVKASDNINLHTITDEENSGKQAQDPHFWLDPVLAQQIVMNIQAGLSKADPAGASTYETNAARYIAKLALLDKAFQNGLKSCQTRTIITSHAAFGYLGTRYNLHVFSIAGISPDEEPGAGKLAELSQLVKDQNIHYVFFESLASPRLADTIAAETGAKTLVFDPIEGLSDAQQKQGKDYLSVQYGNLRSLRTALACQ
jgi:zinc transport system substrate-binding protein